MSKSRPPTRDDVDGLHPAQLQNTFLGGASRILPREESSTGPVPLPVYLSAPVSYPPVPVQSSSFFLYSNHPQRRPTGTCRCMRTLVLSFVVCFMLSFCVVRLFARRIDDDACDDATTSLNCTRLVVNASAEYEIHI